MMNNPQLTVPETHAARRDRPPQRYMTTAKACKQYGLTPGYLRQLASKGLLTSCKYGAPHRDTMQRDRRLSLWLVWELESLLEVVTTPARAPSGPAELLPAGLFHLPLLTHNCGTTAPESNRAATRQRE